MINYMNGFIYAIQDMDGLIEIKEMDDNEPFKNIFPAKITIEFLLKNGFSKRKRNLYVRGDITYNILKSTLRIRNKKPFEVKSIDELEESLLYNGLIEEYFEI